MSRPGGQNLSDQAQLGEPKSRKPGRPPTSAERLAALKPMSWREALTVAARVARSRDPLYAATNLSVREIVGVCELAVTIDETLQQRLPDEAASSSFETGAEQGES